MQTTDELEAQARASLEPGFVPPNLATDKQDAAPDAAKANRSETAQTQQDKVQEEKPAEVSAPDETAAGKPDEAIAQTQDEAKTDDEKDAKNEKKESEYSKTFKEEKRRTEGWAKLNAEKEAHKAAVVAAEARITAASERIRSIEAQLQAVVQSGTLPDYVHSDGKTYPADLLVKVVKDGFAAAGEDTQSPEFVQAESALNAFAALNRQAGVIAAQAPSKEQMDKAQQKLALVRGERPEYRAGSGTDHDKVVKQLLDSAPFMNMIAREPDGIDAMVRVTDLIVAGYKVPALEKEIAELKKQVGEGKKSVAHYEKATAPQKGAIARKPAAAKPIGELSTADLESKARQAFAEAGFV